jgi:hypothetical protein
MEQAQAAQCPAWCDHTICEPIEEFSDSDETSRCYTLMIYEYTPDETVMIVQTDTWSTARGYEPGDRELYEPGFDTLAKVTPEERGAASKALFYAGMQVGKLGQFE